MFDRFPSYTHQRSLTFAGVMALSIAVLIPSSVAAGPPESTGIRYPAVIAYGATGGIPGSNYRVVFRQHRAGLNASVVVFEGKAYGHAKQPRMLVPSLPPEILMALRKLAVAENFYKLPVKMNCPPKPGTGVGATTSFIAINTNHYRPTREVDLSNVKGPGACHAGEFNQFLSVLVGIANFPVSQRFTLSG
ncbi:MAG TPA: hypothetical protein VG815_09040 [Chloroflexota bacterium]|nr:hypothetical protein [Chloroflexota bacterium]